MLKVVILEDEESPDVVTATLFGLNIENYTEVCSDTKENAIKELQCSVDDLIKALQNINYNMVDVRKLV